MVYRLLEWFTAPVLLLQGRRVRRITPVLPQAQGVCSGLMSARPDGALTDDARASQAISKATCQAISTAPGTATRVALRVLIAGDSSAAGVGVADLADAMPGRFTRALAAHIGRAVQWRLCARTGLTAAGLHEHLDHDLAARPVFDVAVIVVGVNDVTARRSARHWLADLEALRARVRRDSPGCVLWWSGLPPMHLFPALPQPLRAYLGARARALDAQLARWVAADPTMHHLPIPALRGDGMMASDGFHPGPRGHTVWGELLARSVAAGWR